MTPHQEISRIIGDFEQAKTSARSVFDGLGSIQLTQRPSPNQWSIAECLAHLNLTARVQVDALKSAIEKGLARNLLAGGEKPRYSWISRKIIAMTEPPPSRKQKAPKRLVPIEFTLQGLLPEFLKLQDELIACAHRSAPLDLVRAKVAFPFFRLLRFNLGAYFHIVAAHQRRHLWQAEQAKRGLVKAA